MLAVDEMVASLVEELEAAGELENTYVFFTSDNGYHLGEHRLRQGKKTPYEEAARVPPRTGSRGARGVHGRRPGPQHRYSPNLR